MTGEEAEKVARALALEKGWTWVGPVRVEQRHAFGLGPLHWHVCSNAGVKGLNVRVEIDDRSARVVKANFLRR